jgi:hypothetical protein
MSALSLGKLALLLQKYMDITYQFSEKTAFSNL